MMDLEHERRLTEVEDRAKSNQYRITEAEKRLDDQEKLISSVSVLAAKQEAVESDVKEIKNDVKELAGKSGKRWDSIVDKILTTITGAILLYILAKLGF